MVQFYFLSILLNILVGVVLISSSSSTELDAKDIDLFDEKKSKNTKIKNVKEVLENDSLFSNETFCLITGALSALIGFIKLFFAYGKTKAGVPIIGDLFPALLGLAGGATVVLEYYSKSFADHDLPDFIETILFNNKKYLGCACIVAAVIHFIIPGFIVF